VHRRELKIRVSVVQFHPWPPFFVGLFPYLAASEVFRLRLQGGALGDRPPDAGA
jgi:hypothetical protein